MLDVFGHDSSLLLQTFPLYKQLGYPLETGKPAVFAKTQYQSPGINQEKVVSFEALKKIVESDTESSKYQIIDARPEGRFLGTDPEPREGLSSGHVPRSISIPFSNLLDPNTRSFLPPDKLQSLFKHKGVSTEKPLILMCGTGVTACVIERGLASANITNQPLAVYDGSWT